MEWLVFKMDEGLQGKFKTKKEAINSCGFDMKPKITSIRFKDTKQVYGYEVSTSDKHALYGNTHYIYHGIENAKISGFEETLNV